jgi:ABC-type nickel/cobalt efflux system permease component RcnA
VALNCGAPLWGTTLAALISLGFGLTLAFLVTRSVAVDAHPEAAPAGLAYR